MYISFSSSWFSFPFGLMEGKVWKEDIDLNDDVNIKYKSD